MGLGWKRKAGAGIVALACAAAPLSSCDDDSPAGGSPAGLDAATNPDGAPSSTPGTVASKNRPRRDGPSGDIAVSLLGSTKNAGTTSLYAQGGTFTRPGQPCSPATARVVGPCEMRPSCSLGTFVYRGGDGGVAELVYDAGTFASAGDITFGGGALAGLGVLGPRSDGSYFRVKTGSPDLAPGAAATATAAGGAIPSWGPISVTVPRYLTLVTPAAVDGGAITIPTGADLEVTWNDGEEGATVAIGFGAGADKSIACWFDAAAGRGTVPKEILAEAKAGGGDTQTMSWGQRRGAVFTAGEFEGVFTVDAVHAALATFR